MKKVSIFSIAVISLCSLKAVGQNSNLPISIKQNINFYDNCNNVEGFAKANSSTPDLFHKDADKRTVGLPENYMGSQLGDNSDSYFGIIAYYADGTFSAKDFLKDGVYAEKVGYGKYSEYVQLPLNIALKSGLTYKVKFKVSLSDKSSYAISGLGAALSTLPVSEKNNSFLKLDNQISSKEVIKDKNNWVEISGNFIAKGDEKYITIGRFEKNFSSEKVVANNEMNNRRAYYYVSSISISENERPDRDKDGIADEEDKCPDMKGISKFVGCPDSDADGIEDSKDKCPLIAGLDKFIGCPDTDGDGIGDSEDMCPKNPGTVASKGCPEISNEVLNVFKQALTGVQFETGKDVIKPSSYNILNNVADIMKKNPTYRLGIEGHTDSQGDDAKNLALSQKRAAAVKKYLSDKQVEAGRMSSQGFGETKPIADNANSQGRAQNRRVEFKVEFEK